MKTLVLAGLSCCLMLVSNLVAAVDVIELKSPGGLDVWLVEDHTVPMIAMEFAFRGGTTQDPDGQEGATRFLSYMLDEGAGDLDSAAFQEQMEDLSIGLGFSVGKEYFTGSLITLSTTIPEAFDLLRLAVNDPVFDPVPIARIRRQILVGLEASENSPSKIAGAEMARAAFPDHVYARDGDGLPEDIGNVTADHLRALHRRIFTRKHLKIAVVGAIGPDQLLPLVDRVFGALPTESEISDVAVPAPIQPAELKIEKDLAQTQISFLGPAYTLDHPDALAAYVANHILGGGSFTSRLFNELREKRGLVYSASSGLSTTRTVGTIVGGLGSQRERADEALDVLKATLRHYAAEGPTAAELESAKKYLIGSFPLRFATTGSIASQLLSLQIAGRTTQYWDQRTDLINAVSLEDVRRVAGEIFSPENMIFVILGG